MREHISNGASFGQIEFFAITACKILQHPEE